MNSPKPETALAAALYSTDWRLPDDPTTVFPEAVAGVVDCLADVVIRHWSKAIAPPRHTKTMLSMVCCKNLARGIIHIPRKAMMATRYPNVVKWAANCFPW